MSINGKRAHEEVAHLSRRRSLATAWVLSGVFACTGSSERPDDSARRSVDDAAADGASLEMVETKMEILCTLTGPPSSGEADVLVHEDNFEATQLDLAKWNAAVGYRGHGAILNTTSPQQVRVENGMLSISTETSSADPRYPYVSGFVDTLGTFARTYGRIEMRARFPFLPGVWFALWGRSWAHPFPELDVEILNPVQGKEGQLYFVNHWAAPPIAADERRAYSRSVDLDLTQFHEYVIDWRPHRLTWSIDGETKLEAPERGIPHSPVYWMINAWVGGWSGAPNPATFAPGTFDVDYVRVYRVAGVLAAPEIFVLRPRTTYSRTRPVEIAVANFDEACAHVTLYDGNRKVWTSSQAPYRFLLRRLSLGPHTLRFVATDGVRSAETSLEVTVER